MAFSMFGRAPKTPSGYTGPGMATSPPILNQPPGTQFDPIQQARNSQIGANLSEQLGYLDQQQRDTIREFGLDDPTDPFSRARLLQQMFQRQQRGNTNSFAARGQLYSGALQRAQNTSSLSYLQQQDSLRKQQSAILARIEQRRAALRSGAESDRLDESERAIDRAIANRPDPSSMPLPENKSYYHQYKPDAGGGRVKSKRRRRRRRK